MKRIVLNEFLFMHKHYLIILLIAFLCQSCFNRDVDRQLDTSRELQVLFKQSGKKKADNWSVFYSEPGLFSIAFPKLPEEDTHTIESSLGKLEMHCFTYEKKDNKTLFLAYSDFPQEAMNSLSTHDFLDQNINAALDGMFDEPEILVKERISHDSKHEGIKVSAYEKDRGFFNYKIILRNNRVYQLMKISFDSTEYVKDHFFRSFQFIDSDTQVTSALPQT